MFWGCGGPFVVNRCCGGEGKVGFDLLVSRLSSWLPRFAACIGGRRGEVAGDIEGGGRRDTKTGVETVNSRERVLKLHCFLFLFVALRVLRRERRVGTG